MLAKLAGAGYVVVIGVPADAGRLKVARRIGAEAALGALDEDIVAWVSNFGDGHGFDLVIDAAGVSVSLKLALDIVRPAGQITKVGWGPQPFNYSLDQLVQKSVTLRGVFRTTGAIALSNGWTSMAAAEGEDFDSSQPSSPLISFPL